MTFVVTENCIKCKYTDCVEVCPVDCFHEAHASDSASRVVSMLGGWQRDPYRRFDFNSPAYQDMVFFHPVVRRVFFDTGESYSQLEEREALLRCYSMSTTKGGGKVFLAAEDAKGRNARLEVTDLRLFLFANGIGILSIGVEGGRLAFEQEIHLFENGRRAENMIIIKDQKEGMKAFLEKRKPQFSGT